MAGAGGHSYGFTWEISGKMVCVYTNDVNK